MMTRSTLALLALLAMAALAADEPPVPAIFQSNADLMAALKKSIQTNPDMATAPVANDGDHYRINIVRRGKAAGAIAHQIGSEVHYIIDGSGTLVTGGKLVRQPNANARGGNAIIEGGETRHVTKGDTVLIPVGTPHWYKDVDGSITYLEVRFDVPVKNTPATANAR